MNWFGVIKNQPSNPLSLYSYEEILEMFETKEENEKLYGYHPIKYIGNLVGFQNLKGDYLDSNEFSRGATLNYSINNYDITQITFSLRVIVVANKLIRFYLELHIGFTNNKLTEDLLRNVNITNKMFSDFVEIYNMPNHKYKNMYASLSTGEMKKLKDVIRGDRDILAYGKDASVLNILRELKL